jgi:hypothetical protein
MFTVTMTGVCPICLCLRLSGPMGCRCQQKGLLLTDTGNNMQDEQAIFPGPPHMVITPVDYTHKYIALLEQTVARAEKERDHAAARAASLQGQLDRAVQRTAIYSS